MAETTLNGLLERLAAFEPNGFPVISLYLNTQADQHGRDNYDAFLRKETRARAKTFAPQSSERESFDRDVERIQAYLAEELKPSANGVAVFACAGADLFEPIQMDLAIPEHRLYIYDQPHLYHLALVNDGYPRYAAVLADSSSAQIFVFGLGRTERKEDVNGVKTRRTKVGGWSQARYQRHTENYQLQHAKEIAERLERIVEEDKIGHVVLAGDQKILDTISQSLSKPVTDKLVDMLKMDASAAEHEVLTATLESLRNQDAKSDADKVTRMFDACRAGGLAVAGLKDTLVALTMGQVDELLISATIEELYPEEEQVEEPLSATAGADSGAATTRSVLLPDELVTKAAQTGATVTFIEDPALLANAGGVGALLRFRI